MNTQNNGPSLTGVVDIIADNISLFLDNGTVKNINDIFWKKNGDSLPVKYSSSPIIKEDSIEGAVIVFSDISAQKQIANLREEVERITRHDLKTPLSGIIGVPQLLKKDKNLTPRQIDFLDMVESSGYRMMEMINNGIPLCNQIWEFGMDNVSRTTYITEVHIYMLTLSIFRYQKACSMHCLC